MDVCFNCNRDATRVSFNDVEYIEVDYAKDKGRMTKFWFIYTKDNKTHTLKYRDNELYWIRE